MNTLFLSSLMTSVIYEKYPIVLKNMSIDIYHLFFREPFKYQQELTGKAQ